MCTSSMPRIHRKERATVPIFDLSSNHLRKFPLGVVNGIYPSFANTVIAKLAGGSSIEKEEFVEVVIPRFGLFDIYASNEDHETNSQSYTIVARATQDTEGRSFVARLNYGRLGPGANVRRAFSSRHRIMYIGSVSS
jgi:hypothetical protein